jgi:hypothetical protein
MAGAAQVSEDYNAAPSTEAAKYLVGQAKENMVIIDFTQSGTSRNVQHQACPHISC